MDTRDKRRVYIVAFYIYKKFMLPYKPTFTDCASTSRQKQNPCPYRVPLHNVLPKRKTPHAATVSRNYAERKRKGAYAQSAYASGRDLPPV